MNITIMLLFLGISSVLLVWAYFHDKRNNLDPNGLSYVKLVGWFTCFMIFGAFMFDGVQYEAGSVEQVAGNTTTITPTYTTYDNHTIGFFLTIMAGIGFIMVFFDLRGVKNV